MKRDEVIYILNDSSRFFKFITSLECPHILEKLKQTLQVPENASHALIYAKMTHAWASDGGVFQLAKRSETLYSFVQLLLVASSGTPKDLVEVFFGKIQNPTSNSIILWSTTNGCSTREPVTGDLAVESVSGRGLSVGLVLDYNGQAVTIIRPGGKLEKLNAGNRKLTFVSADKTREARKAQNAEAPRTRAEENIP